MESSLRYVVVPGRICQILLWRAGTILLSGRGTTQTVSINLLLATTDASRHVADREITMQIPVACFGERQRAGLIFKSLQDFPSWFLFPYLFADAKKFPGKFS